MFLRRLTAGVSAIALLIGGSLLAATPAQATGVPTGQNINVTEWLVNSSNAFTISWTNSTATSNSVMVRSPWPWGATWSTGTLTSSGRAASGAQTITCGSNVTFTISSATTTGDPTCNFQNSAYWKGFWLSGGGLNVAIDATISVSVTSGQVLAPSSPRTDTFLVGEYDNDYKAATQKEVAVNAYADPSAPPPPLVTIDIDANAGECRTTKIQEFQGTWTNAPNSSNCSKNGALFMGFNTSPDGSGTAIAPGGVLHLTGDNRIYAIYETLRAPGAPTDVVAVAGRNSVTVSWKAPADLGSPSRVSYVVRSNPEGYACRVASSAAMSAQGGLNCAISIPASNTAYTFQVVADNFFNDSAPSAPSNAVKPFDLVLETVERPKASLLDRLFKGQGSTLSFTGRAPGLAGSKFTPQLKVGAGDWTNESGGKLTVAENGDVTWSKALSTKLDKQPVDVRFVIGSESSNAYTASVGSIVGLPTAPRNLKLKTGLGKTTVSWQPPANDGGSPVTSYVLRSDLRRFSCTVKAPETSCEIPGLSNPATNGAVEYSVAAVSARGEGRAARAKGEVVYRWVQPLSVTTYPDGNKTELNILFYFAGLTEKQVTVELRIGQNGTWKKRGNPKIVTSRQNRMYWSGLLGPEAKGQSLYLRVSTPYGDTRVRRIR